MAATRPAGESGGRARAGGRRAPGAGRQPVGSRVDQDAGAGERANADVATVDLDRERAVGRRRRDGAGVAGEQRAGFEELEQPGRELELLGDAGDGELLAHVDPGQWA